MAPCESKILTYLLEISLFKYFIKVRLSSSKIFKSILYKADKYYKIS